MHRPLQLTAERLNHGLRRQRLAFERLVSSGRWWDMSRSEKAAAGAPEVREVRWLSLSEAIELLDVTKPFVDEWQRDELARCQLYWRQVRQCPPLVLMLPHYCFDVSSTGSMCGVSPSWYSPPSPLRCELYRRQVRMGWRCIPSPPTRPLFPQIYPSPYPPLVSPPPHPPV
jgi:hypothetical protein